MINRIKQVNKAPLKGCRRKGVGATIAPLAPILLAPCTCRQVLHLLAAIDAHRGDELLLMGGSGALPERHVPRRTTCTCHQAQVVAAVQGGRVVRLSYTACM